MSTKFIGISTLFVFIQIECLFNEGFNDCFRVCLTRFGSSRDLRSQCITNCKQQYSASTIPSDLDKRKSNSTEKQLGEHSAKTEDYVQATTINPGLVKTTTKPITYFAGSIDYTDSKESPIVLDNENSLQSLSTFNVVPQPDHCGFKTIKDMNKQLLGGEGLGRIIGGFDAEPHEFPWVVSIQYFTATNPNESVHFCGGAIITKNYIITAAHCMERFVDKEKALVFKIGVNSPKHNSEQNITATKVIVHERWNSSLQINDIALIKVHPDIQFTTTDGGQFKVNALCLPNTPSEPSGTGILAGWGEQAFKAGVPAKWLQRVSVPFVERDKCHDVYKKYLAKVTPGSKVEVKHNHICAGGKGDEDACRGDSGGALIQAKHRQSFNLGIVSFSVPCAIKDLPTIYTNVVFYMNWIHKNVKTK